VPDDENPSVYRIGIKGFIYSFMLSVGNDTIWQGVIETSAQKCFDQFNGSGEGMNEGCDGLIDLYLTSNLLGFMSIFLFSDS
jgi:hypothetical protein